MKKWQNKANPLVEIATRHKTGLNMRAESIDEVLATDYPQVVSTVKFDGEHTIIHWSRQDRLWIQGSGGHYPGAGDCTLANSYGTMRQDIPPTWELADILSRKGIQEIVLAGELYAVWEDGRKMQLNEVMHHIKSPQNEEEEARLRLAVFDVLFISDAKNGFDDQKQPIEMDYWRKINFLNELVGQGLYVHVVPARQGDISVVKDMWERIVVGRKMEGLVVHTPGGIVKVKVISNMDLVIVGMAKEGERFPRGLAGALLPAFMSPDGTFLVSSKVGTGLNESEQREWFQWIMANQIGEVIINGKPFVVCRPQRVVEIGANEWYAYSEPTVVGLKINGGVEKIGLFPGVKGQKPRFTRDENGKIRERIDKNVNPVDLRLTQCPDFQEEWLKIYEGKQDEGVEEKNRRALEKLFPKQNPPDIVIPFKVVVKDNTVMGDYIALHGLVPGNELPERFRGKIPENEIWIRKDVYNDAKRRKSVLAHEEHELTLMTQKGLTYKEAHERAERVG